MNARDTGTLLLLLYSVLWKFFTCWCGDMHQSSLQDGFLTPSVFGEILYENFLLDSAKLLDLCALYGGSGSKNVALLSKMLENVFMQQPKYHDDVRATMPTILQVKSNGLIDIFKISK